MGTMRRRELIQSSLAAGAALLVRASGSGLSIAHESGFVADLASHHAVGGSPSAVRPRSCRVARDSEFLLARFEPVGGGIDAVEVDSKVGIDA